MIEPLLVRAFGPGDWKVRPAEGWANTSYVAERASERVFVKFDVLIPVLERLADLAIAPRILASGTVDGRAYVIQEFVDGTPPDHSWFLDHLAPLADIFRRVHGDDELRRLLLREGRGSARQVRDIEWAYGVIRRAFPKHAGSAEAFDRFTGGHAAVPGTGPVTTTVATHGDASRKNFLISESGLRLVDWDDVALADPMRDIGPLLWWYVPRPRWIEFLERYGLIFDDDVNARLYSWAACVSLDVTAGLLERGYRERAADFLEDFIAAAQGRPNPHAGY